MSPRFLSEPAAWREIARRIDAKPTGSWDFLCWHFAERFPEYRHKRVKVTPETRDAMDARVQAHLAPDSISAIHVHGDGKRARLDVRVLAALFLALEAEDEQRAARRGAA